MRGLTIDFGGIKTRLAVRRYLWITAVLLSAPVRSAETLDPLVLVEGIYAAREQIPPSKLKLRERIRDPRNQRWQERVVEAYFEGAKYRVDQIEPQPTVRALVDGSKVIHLDNNRHVNLRDRLEHMASDPLYDARLLGMDCLNSWASYLLGKLDFRGLGWECTVLGQETIRGVKVWHVQVRAPEENQFLTLDYWVEPQRGFRVHRYATSSIVPQRSPLESYYENPRYPWLPSRVEGRIESHTEAAGWWVEEIEFHLLEAATVRQFPSETWTIVGLHPPLNAQVIDYRLEQVVGYWDGKGVRDTPVRVRPARGVGWAGLAVLAVLLTAPMAWWVWSCWRKTG